MLTCIAEDALNYTSQTLHLTQKKAEETAANTKAAADETKLRKFLLYIDDMRD